MQLLELCRICMYSSVCMWRTAAVFFAFQVSKPWHQVYSIHAWCVLGCWSNHTTSTETASCSYQNLFARPQGSIMRVQKLSKTTYITLASELRTWGLRWTMLIYELSSFPTGRVCELFVFLVAWHNWTASVYNKMLRLRDEKLNIAWEISSKREIKVPPIIRK